MFFYEIRATRKRDVDWRLDVQALFADLRKKPPTQLMHPVHTGDASEFYDFALALEDKAGFPAIAFVRCRKDGLPMLAEQIDLQPFDLQAGQQLAEMTHVVFFDNHIVGAEYNHYGPRVTSLASYLSAIAPQHLPDNKRVRIQTLKIARGSDVLEDANAVRSLEIAVVPQLLGFDMYDERIGYSRYNYAGCAQWG